MGFDERGPKEGEIGLYSQTDPVMPRGCVRAIRVPAICGTDFVAPGMPKRGTASRVEGVIVTPKGSPFLLTGVYGKVAMVHGLNGKVVCEANERAYTNFYGTHREFVGVCAKDPVLYTGFVWNVSDYGFDTEENMDARRRTALYVGSRLLSEEPGIGVSAIGEGDSVIYTRRLDEGDRKTFAIYRNNATLGTTRKEYRQILEVGGVVYGLQSIQGAARVDTVLDGVTVLETKPISGVMWFSMIVDSAMEWGFQIAAFELNYLYRWMPDSDSWSQYELPMKTWRVEGTFLDLDGTRWYQVTAKGSRGRGGSLATFLSRLVSIM